MGMREKGHSGLRDGGDRALEVGGSLECPRRLGPGSGGNCIGKSSRGQATGHQRPWEGVWDLSIGQWPAAGGL